MKYKSIGLLLLILAIGVFFRFVGINWDQGFHLHPDERFLTMVGIASKIPNNFSTYLNPNLSPLNPTNNNFSFFVYGIFPITLVKILAVFLNKDSYDLFNILGRNVSAIFDCGIILLVFLISKLLTEKYNLSKTIPFIAALFYAISVLPIQLAHFFTSDIFLSFFITLSLYFILLFERRKQIYWLIISGVTFGIALSCKVTAIYISPLFFIIIPIVHNKKYSAIMLAAITFILSSYISLHLFDPYMFQSANFLNPMPNSHFIDSIVTLKSYDNPNVWYPPGVQWVSKTPIIFSLINIFLWGLGPIYFLFMCIGALIFARTKKIVPILLISWCIIFFLYQSIQNVKTMRYFIFLYPFFAIFAGIGYTFIAKKINKYLLLALSLFLFIWPLMFLGIYTKPHTRVTASYWIEKNIPAGSTILTEYWDDPLPLNVSGILEKGYKGIQLHVFDLDTPEKWQIFNRELNQGEYLILSSNRGWGSIPTVPSKYPKMAKFYQDLFAGKLAYKKEATFTSYPSLMYIGIPLTIPDESAEEAFTVFDHPKVMIFKKEN